MGNSYGFRCKKCGDYKWISEGIGFLFPTLYEQTIEEIKDGKWGEKYHEFFEVFPNAATDVENGVYLCEHCGNIFNEINQGLYLPKDERMEIKPSDNRWCVAMPQIGKRYVTACELEKDYFLYEAEVHSCPQCGKNAKRVKGDISKLEPICSKCRTRMELEDLEFWD